MSLTAALHGDTCATADNRREKGRGKPFSTPEETEILAMSSHKP
jgi:hypothetical protein